MKRIITLFLVFSIISTLFCPVMSVEAASAEELYFDFDGTEDYASWCTGAYYYIENGLYRLITGNNVATGDFALPNQENFTIEARIRYSNTAPRHSLYTANNGIFIHMLYDGVYVENGKESTTIVKVIKRFKDATQLDVTLITGRTHQIRAHLAHCKLSIVCDPLYGGNQKPVRLSEIKRSWKGDVYEERPLLNRLALHAYKISFVHPTTNEKEFWGSLDERNMMCYNM